MPPDNTPGRQRDRFRSEHRNVDILIPLARKRESSPCPNVPCERRTYPAEPHRQRNPSSPFLIPPSSLLKIPPQIDPMPPDNTPGRQRDRFRSEHRNVDILIPLARKRESSPCPNVPCERRTYPAEPHRQRNPLIPKKRPS